MAWFKKKRNRSNLETVQTYAPTSTLTVRSFLPPEALLKAEREAPSKIKTYLSKTTPDPYNESYYDGEVLHARSEALSELDEQNAERIEDIFVLFGSKAGGDMILCKSKLESCEREMSEVEQELAELTKAKRFYNTPKKKEVEHDA